MLIFGARYRLLNRCYTGRVNAAIKPCLNHLQEIMNINHTIRITVAVFVRIVRAAKRMPALPMRPAKALESGGFDQALVEDRRLRGQPVERRVSVQGFPLAPTNPACSRSTTRTIAFLARL